MRVTASTGVTNCSAVLCPVHHITDLNPVLSHHSRDSVDNYIAVFDCIPCSYCDCVLYSYTFLRKILHCTYFHVRLEVLAAVTMRNAVFWEINPHFIPHMRHIRSPLQSPAS
jgi:hypothetical protein